MRERYLLVHTHRGDPAGDQLGDEIVSVLQRFLPAAHALVARAADAVRISSLLMTKQAMVAILHREELRRAVNGQDEFQELGQLKSMALLRSVDHFLVCRPDMPMHHGYLIVETLLLNRGTMALALAEPGDTVPLHPGAGRYARGEPLDS